MYITWRDEKIRWNPLLYNGITSQMYRISDVWLPHLVLGNPYESSIETEKKWDTVRILFNGTAVYAPGEVFKATCAVDTSYYPYDTQECFLVFAAWGYTLQEMTIISISDKVLQTFYIENGEWSIEKTVANVTVENNFITFWFTLKRKSLFHTVNVLLPVAFMSLITLFTFLIPVESGERVSYSITCLLAIAVFLTIVSDNLPKTSNPMSVMCYYLTSMLVISILICLTTIINLRIYFSDKDTHAPAWCEPFVRVMLCRCEARGPKDREAMANQLNLNKGKQSSTGSSNSWYMFHDKEIVRHDVNMVDEMPYLSSDKHRQRFVSWEEASFALDRVCLIVFTVVIILVTGLFFGMMINNSK